GAAVDEGDAPLGELATEEPDLLLDELVLGRRGAAIDANALQVHGRILPDEAAARRLERTALPAERALGLRPGRHVEPEQRTVRHGQRPLVQAPVHDRARRGDAPSRLLDRPDRLARRLAGREDVFDDGDRLPRLERKAPTQREGSVLTLDEHGG